MGVPHKSKSFKTVRRRLLYLAVLALALGACGGGRRGIAPNPANPVYRVAVLPFYNATNDVGGPSMVRELFAKRLDRFHYDSVALEDVDRLLVDRMGITLGSQLELTTARELGETLGVDGVFYGYLLDFDQITTGVYNVKKVRVGLKLVDTNTGAIVWARGLGVKSLLTSGDVGTGIAILKELKGLDDEFFSTIKGTDDIPGLRQWHVMKAAKVKKAGNAAIISLGEQLITKALGVHLKPETNVMLKRVMRGLPAGPGSVRVRPEPLPAMPVY
jgi:hypothetical protein